MLKYLEMGIYEISEKDFLWRYFMKAAVIEKFNAPWVIKEMPDPIPKAGQVLIKIHASGMCGTDVHVHRGYFPVKLPIVAGHEPVGEIVNVGAGVPDFKVGDRVGVSWVQKGCGRCPYCQGKKPLYCSTPNGKQSWMDIGGGNSELMLAWADGCTLLPEKLSYELAAPLFCAGFTIASGLYNARPKPGERVAVLGVGGLGHLAIQYAKAKGHYVLAVTHSKDKVDLCKKLGADEVVIGDNPGKALKLHGGADIILNTGSSSALASQAMEGLLPEGRLVGMGIDQEDLKVNPVFLLDGQREIKGSAQNNRAELVDILNLTAEGKVKPIIEVYSLNEINKALDRLINDKVRFRAVISYKT
jgi:D-arabinose 1-dehydrogenase-like Zn-dependent alcohol dehydrogenase